MELCFVSILCILVSIFVSSILFSYYRSVSYIKKSLLTRLDNLLILNLTFGVCGQCFICIFSLLCDKRNEFLYLAVFVIIYGSLTIAFGITIVLSFCRVYIIMAVSKHGCIKPFRIWPRIHFIWLIFQNQSIKLVRWI